jgi:hypothetical protein
MLPQGAALGWYEFGPLALQVLRYSAV